MNDFDGLNDGVNGGRKHPALQVMSFFVVVAAIAGFGMLGYYAYNIGSSNSEESLPIITAHNAPARVAPENPGGMFIEHQDKKIFDRITSINEKHQDQRAERNLGEELFGKENILTDEEPDITLLGSISAEQASDNSFRQDNQQGINENMPQNFDVEKMQALIAKANERNNTRQAGNNIQTASRDNNDAIRTNNNVASGRDIQGANAFFTADELAQITGNANADFEDQEFEIANISSNTNNQAVSNNVSNNNADQRLYNAQMNARAQMVNNITPSARGAGNMNSYNSSSDIERYLVQLGSYRSEDGARQDLVRLSRKSPEYIAAMPHRIAQKNISGRGTFFRLQVGNFADKSNARFFCQNLKQQNIDCFVVNK